MRVAEGQEFVFLTPERRQGFKCRFSLRTEAFKFKTYFQICRENDYNFRKIGEIFTKL